MATYISTFNEYVAQFDWNESSLVARFRRGLKDEILDSVATAENQPRRLHEWMAMASRIDERLWSRRRTCRPTTESPSVRAPRFPSRNVSVGKSQSEWINSGPVPMELGTVRRPPALARTTAERLEYQRQGKCWGCGEIGHLRTKCPTNPSRPLVIAATLGAEGSDSGKEVSQD